MGSAIFVTVRLFETWRIASPGSSHQISIFGEKLSYPTANFDAIVIMLLAALGSVVTVLALSGAMPELQASRRFHRRLVGRELQHLHGAILITDAEPRAFCAGLLRPQVYVSTGAIKVLSDAARGIILAEGRSTEVLPTAP